MSDFNLDGGSEGGARHDHDVSGTMTGMAGALLVLGLVVAGALIAQHKEPAAKAATEAADTSTQK